MKKQILITIIIITTLLTPISSYATDFNDTDVYDNSVKIINIKIITKKIVISISNIKHIEYMNSVKITINLY